MKLFDAVAHIGFEPWLLRWTGTTLINDLPVFVAEGFANQSSGFAELQGISRMVRHRLGDAVRREENLGVCPENRIDLGKGFAKTIGLCFNEFRMIETHSRFLDHGGTLAGLKDRRSDVLAVLTATAVATEHRSEESDRASATILLHGLEGVGKHGVPVAVAPVDWKFDSAAVQFGLDCSDEIAALLIDRADTTEMVVMLGDFKHPFTGDIFASEHIFQKWHHVLGAFGATKRNKKNRIDRDLVQRG